MRAPPEGFKPVTTVRFLLRSAWFIFGSSMLLCLAAATAYPQTPEPGRHRFKFDEYGTIGQCDHSARLDNLAITLQNQIDATASIVYYGPKEPGERTLEIIKDYLINSRGIEEHRIKTSYAGQNDDLKQPRIQLWVLPPSQTLPPFDKYRNDLETFTGLYEQAERWDVMNFGEGEGSGPPIARVSWYSFVQMLKTRPDTVAYLVAFNGRKAAPRAWKRVADKEFGLFRESGIEQSRIKVIYGGEAKDTMIQQWILEKDQPPPVIAGTEGLPAKAVSLYRFSVWELGEESENRAFESLLDVVRTSEKLRVVFVVHGSPIEVSAEAEPAIQIVEPIGSEPSINSITTEPQQRDLYKVVEKWKAQLIDAHKLSFDRVIVLFAKPREDEGNFIETWIVPNGAAMPDPDEEPLLEEEDDEAPVENGKTEKQASP
ncbi:MAG TPA: hypothetical protein VJU84_20450 [Pyrinomonadaceae bacterium]|nr:hypothetical protein [Pyrinomonadaceae bacterium]